MVHMVQGLEFLAFSSLCPLLTRFRGDLALVVDFSTLLRRDSDRQRDFAERESRGCLLLKAVYIIPRCNRAARTQPHRRRRLSLSHPLNTLGARIPHRHKYNPTRDKTREWRTPLSLSFGVRFALLLCIPVYAFLVCFSLFFFFFLFCTKTIKIIQQENSWTSRILKTHTQRASLLSLSLSFLSSCPLYAEVERYIKHLPLHHHYLFLPVWHYHFF